MDHRTYDAPVEKGKQYEVNIEELSRRGDGLAHIEGFVVFVPNTRSRDHINIEIMQVRERFAIGERTQ